MSSLQVVKDVNDYLKEKGRPCLTQDLTKNLCEQVSSLLEK
jgi:hypothetical protein